MPTLTAEPPAVPLPVRQRPVYRRFDPSRVLGQMTVDEWTVFLEKSLTKSNYVYGEVIEVAGASPEHNLVAMNAGRAIGNALEAANSSCEVLGSDQKICVQESRLYYFPDLIIVCGNWSVDLRDAIHNPAAIIEVLSPSTEADDRTDKFREYQQIESLHHYLLIDQNRVAVTHFEKVVTEDSAERWAIAGDYRAPSDTLTLAFEDATVSISLSQIYRRVTFPDAAPSTEE